MHIFIAMSEALPVRQGRPYWPRPCTCWSNKIPGIYEMLGTGVSFLSCLSVQGLELLEGHRHKVCPGETRTINGHGED
jgi:hypothetical protein